MITDDLEDLTNADGLSFGTEVSGNYTDIATIGPTLLLATIIWAIYRAAVVWFQRLLIFMRATLVAMLPYRHQGLYRVSSEGDSYSSYLIQPFTLPGIVLHGCYNGFYLVVGSFFMASIALEWP